MARKLKTYQTSQGFYDLAIAAPSMKAALEAWGMKSNLFHHGFAWESDDRRVIDDTLKAPGVTLRRPVGSRGRFVENPSLPKDLPAHAIPDRHIEAKKHKGKKQAAKKKPAARIDEKAAKKAAATFEKRQREREINRRKEEAALSRQRARREREVKKIQGRTRGN